MADTGDPRIRLAFEDAIAVITLARPEKCNALDYDMLLALERAAHMIDSSEEACVVILTGEGDRSFCSGGDIEDWSARPPRNFGQVWVRHGHRVFDTLARLRQPLIAALNGSVLGGGLELAATADFRIAEEHIEIGQPEPGLGIIPGWSGTQRVVRRFGARLVRQMALRGVVYNAAQSVSLDLADSIVPKGQSLSEARRWAETICSRSPLAVEQVKALINAAEGEEIERVLESAAGAFAATTSELREGVQAFRQKRKPNFQGK
jgi:enoyl-CoA hydratase/carnithine racemase